MADFYEAVNKKPWNLILYANLFYVEADSLFVKCKLVENFLFFILSQVQIWGHIANCETSQESFECLLQPIPLLSTHFWHKEATI